MLVRTLTALAAALAFFSVTAHAQQSGEMFRGKEISLLIGGGPGGGADAYARLLARHYGRMLPGTPSIVAKNVLGAGGLKHAVKRVKDYLECRKALLAINDNSLLEITHGIGNLLKNNRSEKVRLRLMTLTRQ
jgi:tripartite-type tricarboxylate transporter receptor subunit TctC